MTRNDGRELLITTLNVFAGYLIAIGVNENNILFNICGFFPLIIGSLLFSHWFRGR